MNKKDKMYQRITAHGENLNKIFNTELEPVALCKKLRRLEFKASTNSEAYCNGEYGELKYQRIAEEIEAKVDKILKFKSKAIPVFINGDPRGYALKVESEWVSAQNINMERDWGGYGLLAPDLRGEGV
jgi:hypothetical protein